MAGDSLVSRRNGQMVAVITGASRGIGRALTELLASSGDLVFAVARNEKHLIELKNSYPEFIVPVAADITLAADRLKIMNAIKGIKINFLVNNVGIITPLKQLEKYSELELRYVFDTNVIAPIMLTNKMLSQLKNGRILNVTTVAAEQVVEGAASYNITKAAVNMWTKALQVELRKKNILAGYAIPGEVDTEMQNDLRIAQLEEFPLATQFEEAAKKNTLISPKTVATFLNWILKHVSDFEFQTNKPWNIYNLENQYFWLPKNQFVPLPLNADKMR